MKEGDHQNILMYTNSSYKNTKAPKTAYKSQMKNTNYNW